MDEVFGSENFVSQIVFRKTSGILRPAAWTTAATTILWYAKT